MTVEKAKGRRGPDARGMEQQSQDAFERVIKSGIYNTADGDQKIRTWSVIAGA